MNTYVLRSFLSPDNVRLHTDYLNILKDTHSINEKSIPEIKGKTPFEISRSSLKEKDKNDILLNFISIKSHETYFSSFTLTPAACPALRKYYSSEAAFLFEIATVAKDICSDFLYIRAVRGRPEIVPTRAAGGVYVTWTPVLALDLCEHAYFLDYRFRRDEYIHRAIEHLDLSLLNAYVK